MIKLYINRQPVEVEEGTTLLEAAQFFGIEIPTLCYHEGLSPYGACRLCVVEIGEGTRSQLVASCTYPAQEGLKVRTHSERVVKTRKMMVELHLALCPTSKKVQDLASKLSVRQVRFKPRNEDCILCGLCTRICAEQMDAQAIGFVERGYKRKIATPFNRRSETCRLCGACMYVCPACQMRCMGPSDDALCNACLSFEPTCLDERPDMLCFMGPAGDCGTCVKKKS